MQTGATSGSESVSGVRIRYDSSAPTASIEFMITRPLADYDLLEVQAETPRDVDPMLASQGFKDLLDDARAILERTVESGSIEIVQITGAICRDAGVHRPGIWLVLRESKPTRGDAQKEMSPQARVRVAAAADSLQASLGLS